MPGSIWQLDQIGDPAFQGLTLGAVIIYGGAGTFLKASYPGMRALRVNNGVPTLTAALPDSQSIPASATVEVWY
jgi:hypothetical protein